VAIDIMRERRNAHRIFWGELFVKRPFGKRIHKWECIIIMRFREIFCEDVNSVELVRVELKCRLLGRLC
jgi:hypothetical protein